METKGSVEGRTEGGREGGREGMPTTSKVPL